MQGYRPDFTPIKRNGHKTGRGIPAAGGWKEYSDYDNIDLHEILTAHSKSVRLMPIETNIMRNSGLHAGGFILVDKALKPVRGSIVVVRYNGATVVRRLEKSLTMWALVADDPREQKLLIHPDAEVEALGVVTYAIKPTLVNKIAKLSER